MPSFASSTDSFNKELRKHQPKNFARLIEKESTTVSLLIEAIISLAVLALRRSKHSIYFTLMLAANRSGVYSFKIK